MELNIDTGVEEFSVNGRGVLRFNPADPNLYHRFFAAGKTLERYDAELTAALGQLGGGEQQRAAAGLALLQDYDGRIKRLLGEIFGAENDFDAILNGVNLAGVGANGRRVVQNLLEALTPILREGAERRLHAAADAAEAAAQAARAARGAECRAAGACRCRQSWTVRRMRYAPTTAIFWSCCAGWAARLTRSWTKAGAGMWQCGCFTQHLPRCRRLAGRRPRIFWRSFWRRAAVSRRAPVRR